MKKEDKKNQVAELNKKIKSLVDELSKQANEQEKIIDECVELGFLPNTLKYGSVHNEVSISMPTHQNHLRKKNGEIKECINHLIRNIGEQENNIINW
jgi:uncharacterized coiled-coil DUF342 family protein